MKKVTVLLMIVCTLAINSQAQKNTGSEYKTAVGARISAPGIFSGSLKHFLFPAGALEVHAGFGHESYYYGLNYFRIGAMYQHHFPIGNVPGFKWYVGGGAFFQFMDYKRNYDNYSKALFALHAVGGVDYKFSKIPLNVSADWMPTVFLGDNPYDGFRGSYGGIAARYTFR